MTANFSATVVKMTAATAPREARDRGGQPIRTTVLVQKNPVWLEENIAHSMDAEDDTIITAFSGSEGTPNGTYGARLESFGCPVQMRGVIIGRPISAEVAREA